ncbi:hypothetical protein QBC34DRAFT_377734 [Podospora aff. communis PSN243]|uniref:Uncharacterized protein n=1 Tax=Podospora aff. communis PSN243 TaxID=3040156 RepID=A0AAV9GTL0_9PEZI|nr:hypothetical protein QBC34DRAFT_377734 [Podospora aff. communis PSN243]
MGHCCLLKKGYQAALEYEKKSIFETLERELDGGDPMMRQGDCAGSFARYCPAIVLLKLGRLEEGEAMIMMSLWLRQERIWGPGLMNKEGFRLA